MASNTSTRRGILGAMAIAPVAIAASAMAVPTGSSIFRAKLDAADRSRDRFNNLPPDLETDNPAEHQREVQALIASCQAADRAEPTTWQEFTRWVEHITDEGHSAIDDDNAERLLSHTRRLACVTV